MKIKMLFTRRGTEDGFAIRQFKADEEYDVKKHLALAFMAAGFAVPVREDRESKKGKAKVQEKRSYPVLGRKYNESRKKLFLPIMRKKNEQ